MHGAFCNPQQQSIRGNACSSKAACNQPAALQWTLPRSRLRTFSHRPVPPCRQKPSAQVRQVSLLEQESQLAGHCGSGCGSNVRKVLASQSELRTLAGQKDGQAPNHLVHACHCCPHAFLQPHSAPRNRLTA